MKELSIIFIGGCLVYGAYKIGYKNGYVDATNHAVAELKKTLADVIIENYKDND